MDQMKSCSNCDLIYDNIRDFSYCCNAEQDDVYEIKELNKRIEALEKQVRNLEHNLQKEHIKEIY